MKQKLALKIVIVAVLLAALFVLLWWNQNKQFAVYTDQTNKVQFTYPKTWQVGSQEGFITLLANPTAEKGLKVIVTVNPAMFFVEVRGLTDQAETVKLGNKTYRLVHKEEQGLTFTHLYLQSQNNQRYLFEVSPWQKDQFDKDIIKVLKTFKPL